MKNLLDVFPRIIHWSTQRASVVILCLTLITLASALGLPKLRSQLLLHDLIDPTLPAAQKYHQFKQNFSQGESLFLVFELKSSQLTSIEEWRKSLQNDFGDKIKIRTAYDLRAPQFKEGKLWYLKVLEGQERSELSKLHTTPWNHLFTDSHLKYLAYEVQLARPSNSQFGSYPKDIMDSLMKQVLAIDHPDFKVFALGATVHSFYAFKGIQKNILLNGLIFLALLFLLRYFLRSWRPGFFLILTLIMSGAIVHGLMGHFSSPMTILSSGLFLMLILSSIEDFIFLSQHEKQIEGGFITAAQDLALPSFLTSLTTILGFGSLAFSGINILEQFGIYAALGAFCEWVMTFLFLPALFSKLGLTHLSGSAPPPSFVIQLSRIRVPKLLTILLLSLYLLLPSSFAGLTIADSPLNIFPSHHDLLKNSQQFKQHFGWLGQIQLVANPTLDSKRWRKIEAELLREPMIQKIESENQILSTFKKAFPLPALQKLIQTELSLTPLTGKFISSLGESRMVLYIKDIDYHSIVKLRSKIELLCKQDCWSVGELISYSEFMAQIPKSLMTSLGLSVALVALVIFITALVLGRLRGFLPFLLSSLWGSVFMLTLMSWLEIPLNFFTSVFIVALIGLTGDNALQFIVASKNGQHLQDGVHLKAASSVICTLVSVILCLFFIFSAFQPPQTLGPLLALGFLASYIGDVAMVKSFRRSS